MEEDSFEVRVKRLFGSQLFESVPRSSFPSSSWSVVDGEVERREWNRERGFGPDRSEDPCSSDFAEGGCFAKKRSSRRSEAEDFELDVDENGDDPEAEGLREEDYGGDEPGEESEIRASIGLDPTLDNEDEEDEFDRAALGRDTSAERLYMGDIKKHGPHLNYYSIFAEAEDEPYDVPRHFHKDPRADHLAAGVRIEEDQKAAEDFPAVPNHSKAEVAVDDFKLKPILKRKELHDDSKPKKRVRFDHASKADNELISSAVESNSAMLDESPGLPDYIRNPSKYTHYTFGNYQDSDSANKGAFEDLHDLLYRKSNREQLQQHMDDEPPKSITFNPRRKSIDAIPDYSGSIDARESDSGVARSTGIAAGESFEAGANKIDEDDLEETPMDTETPADAERASSSSRGGRQYRSLSASDV